MGMRVIGGLSGVSQEAWNDFIAGNGNAKRMHLIVALELVVVNGTTRTQVVIPAQTECVLHRNAREGTSSRHARGTYSIATFFADDLQVTVMSDGVVKRCNPNELPVRPRPVGSGTSGMVRSILATRI